MNMLFNGNLPAAWKALIHMLKWAEYTRDTQNVNAQFLIRRTSYWYFEITQYDWIEINRIPFSAS